MTVSQRTRQKIWDLASALVNDSHSDSEDPTVGWFLSRKSKTRVDPENDQPDGFSLTGRNAAVFLDALNELQSEQTVEHLPRWELDNALAELVLDLYDNSLEFNK